MAIAFRASGAVATGTTSLSIAQPTGTTTGDVLVVFIVDHATSGTVTAPAGWTAAGVIAGTNGRFSCFTAVVGQNSLGASPWSFTGLTTRAVGFMQGFSGGSSDFAHQPDVTASVRTNASGTTGTLGITPGNNGDMVIAGFAAFASGSTWSAQAVATAPTLSNAGGGANSTFCSVNAASGILSTAAATGASSATMGTAGVNAGILLSIKAPNSATSTPSGVASTSAETNGLGEPVSLPSGVTSTSALANAIAQTVGLPSGISATSAENNPTASSGTNGTATATGVASTSGEANPIGEPISLPAGLSASSLENNPSASGTGIAAAGGTSATSAESNPIGDPVSLPSGLAATSVENNPTAAGVDNATALPAGISATSAENNALGAPVSVPLGASISSVESDPIALPVGLASGQTTASSKNNPLGLPNSFASGQAVVSAENNPTSQGTGIATVVGLSLLASEHDPDGQDVCFPAGQAATSAESNPLGLTISLPPGQSTTAAQSNPFGLAVSLVSGVSLVATEHNPAYAALPSGLVAVSAETNPLSWVSGTIGRLAVSSSENSPLGTSSAIIGNLSLAAEENDPSAAARLDGTSLPPGVSLASLPWMPLGSSTALNGGVSAQAVAGTFLYGSGMVILSGAAGRRAWRLGNRSRGQATAGTITIQSNIPAYATDKPVTVSFGLFDIVSIAMRGSHSLTLKLNDPTAPRQIIEIDQGPVVFRSNEEYDCNIGTDVSSIFVTNQSNAAATLALSVRVGII